MDHLLPPDADAVQALTEELQKVRRRGVVRIDEAPRLLPLPPLPLLEELAGVSDPNKDSGRRSQAIRQLLVESLAFLEPESIPRDDWSATVTPSETVALLFGLTPRFERYSPSRLSELAAETLVKFRHRPSSGTGRAANELTEWRARICRVLANAILVRASDRPAELRDPPRDLPLGPSVLVGREDLVADLASGAHLAIVITGPPGVGKTSVAREIAHSGKGDKAVAFVDLQGFGPSAAPSSDDAVRLVLERLGQKPEALPKVPTLLDAHYRSMLHRTRVTLVVDNVADVETARRLLPGEGASARLIMTSRDSLSSLGSLGGVRLQTLDMLPAADAERLLTWHAGPRLAAEEPEALRELATLCGGLPFALTIVGSRLRSRKSLHGVVEELRAESPGLAGRIYAPDLGLAVSDILNWSIRRLTPEDRSLLHQIAWFPVSTVSREMLAHLNEPGWESSVLRLLTQNLITEDVLGRLTLHSLTRDHLRSSDTATDASPLVLAAVKGLAESVRRYVDELSRRDRHQGEPSVRELDPSRDFLDLHRLGPGESHEWALAAVQDFGNLLELVTHLTGYEEVAAHEKLLITLHRSGFVVLVSLGYWEWAAPWLERLLPYADESSAIKEHLLELAVPFLLKVMFYGARTHWHLRTQPIYTSMRGLLNALDPSTDLPSYEPAVKGAETAWLVRESLPRMGLPEDSPVELLAATLSGEPNLANEEVNPNLKVLSMLYEVQARQSGNVEDPDVIRKATQAFAMGAFFPGRWDFAPPAIWLATRYLEAGNSVQAREHLEEVRKYYAALGQIGHESEIEEWIKSIDASQGQPDIR